jgi:hypothetical protein
MQSEWSLEELKRSIVDSAEDYDRIVNNMNKDGTYEEEGETQSSSKE